MKRSFDYIIVGAGSAGCVLANRLTSDPDTRVLLIEAGGSDRFPKVRIPAFTATLYQDPRFAWHYYTVPQVHLNGRRCLIPQGKVLGGSSSINAMVYIRGNPLDYRRWREMGNVGWDWDDVFPYFKEMENNADREGDFHGHGGPLHVGDIPTTSVLTRTFVDAAVELGLPRNPDFNGEFQEGAGIFQTTVHHGLRWSAASAFLRPVLKRRNLVVMEDCRVRRIIIEGKRAIGVELRAPGGISETIAADREVVVCAGAIGSPRLLLVSGVGPADELRSVGVEPTHDLPGVGKNFHDHIGVGSVFQCKGKGSYDGQDRFWPAIGHGARLLFTRNGLATTTGCEGCAYVKSEPNVAYPDLSLHFLPASVVDSDAARPAGGGMTIGGNLLKPKSRGVVRLRSGDCESEPLVDPNYLAEPEDMKALIECIKWAREIVATKAMRPFLSGEVLPGPSVRSVRDIEAYVRCRAGTDYHPAGTCKMGSDEFAVVDERLRVRGIEGLRVADSSVIPLLPSGNTNAPTMMIAARAADMIRGRGSSGMQTVRRALVAEAQRS